MLNDINDFQNTYPAYPVQKLPPSSAAVPQPPVYPPNFFACALPDALVTKRRSHVQLVPSLSLFLKTEWRWSDYVIILSFFFVGSIIGFLGSWDDSPVRTPELNAYFAAIGNVGQVLALCGPVAYFFLRWLGGKFLRMIGAIEVAAAFILFFGNLNDAGTLILPNRILWSIVISVAFAILYTGIRLFIRFKNPLPLPKE